MAQVVQRWLTALMVFALLAACTTTPPNTPDDTSAWTTSSPADGAAPRVGGHGWDVSLRTAGSPYSTLSLGSPDDQVQAAAARSALTALTGTGSVTAGEPVHIQLDGGALPAQGATLVRTLSAPVPDGSRATLAFYDPDHDAWTAVPTALSADRVTLTANVDHFSLWTDLVDDATYGLGWTLDTRVSAPTCTSTLPSWVARNNITYLDDKNAPLRWCAGSDPKNKDLLVVKVKVNRGYGVAVEPKAVSTWAWDSLFQGGPEDVLVRIMTGSIRLAGGYGRGTLLVPGGAEADLAFNEDAVRAAGGNPLVHVDAATDYLVAGLTYTAITKLLGAGDGPAAALVALLGLAQCGTTFTRAVAEKNPTEATKAAMNCLKSGSDDVARNAATILAKLYPAKDPRLLGQLAGRVGGKLWQVWAAGIVFGVTTWFADRTLDPAAWSLSAFPAVKARAVRVQDLLTAPIPAYCRHPAGRLRGGELQGLGPTEGYANLADVAPTSYGSRVPPVLVDLTGDQTGDAAAVLQCSAGGVTWPDMVLFYGPGPKLLGTADLTTVHEAEHADIATMTATNGDIRLNWSTYEGCCSDQQSWTARLHWNGKQVQILDATRT